MSAANLVESGLIQPHTPSVALKLLGEVNGGEAEMTKFLCHACARILRGGKVTRALEIAEEFVILCIFI